MMDIQQRLSEIWSAHEKSEPLEEGVTAEETIDGLKTITISGETWHHDMKADRWQKLLPLDHRSVAVLLKELKKMRNHRNEVQQTARQLRAEPQYAHVITAIDASLDAIEAALFKRDKG